MASVAINFEAGRHHLLLTLPALRWPKYSTNASTGLRASFRHVCRLREKG